MKSNFNLDCRYEPLLEYVNKRIAIQEDIYKEALLSRIKSSLLASKLLQENDFWVEVPVLIRVAFEHSCRLYQYSKDADSVVKHHPNAFKLLGRSPGPDYTIKALGNEIRLTYEFLCSFSHADVASLVLVSSKEVNLNSIKMIINIALYSIYYIMISVFEEDTNERQKLQNELEQFMNNMVSELDGTFEKTDDLEQLRLITEQIKPFAKEEMNDFLKQVLQLATEDKDKAVQEIGKCIETIYKVN